MTTPTSPASPIEAPLIVVNPSTSPAETKKQLAKHEKNIRTFARGAMKGAAELYGYAYLAGREMLAAKTALPHGNSDEDGGLVNWLGEKFPDLTERTCRRWMTFAREVEAKAPALPEFQRTPLQLTNGKITAKGREAILELIPQLMDGKNMTSFMRDSKLARDPEHQAHTPPAELTAEEKVKAEIAQVTALLHSAVESMVIVSEMSDLDKAKVPPAEWEKVLNACLQLSPLARELSKSKRAPVRATKQATAKARWENIKAVSTFCSSCDREPCTHPDIKSPQSTCRDWTCSTSRQIRADLELKD